MPAFVERGSVDRCFTGDRDALRELVERHQGLVYGVALAVTGDPTLAEDVSQETFVEAWQHLPSLRDRERLGPWLAGIARNLGHNALRKLRRQRVSAPQAKGTPTPLDDMLARESRLVVRECLAQVPDALREALVLFYLKEQSVRQVAQELGVSEELVKQRLSRGRRSMREGMAEALGTALDRVRPGPALAGSVLAALTGATRTAAAAGAMGKVLFGMSMKKASLAALLVALAVTGIWYGQWRTSGHPPPAAAASEATPREGLSARAPASRQGLRTASAARRSHEAAWRQLREMVRQARQRREEQARAALSVTAQASTSPATASDHPGSLDKDTIQEAIRAILPLIKECYEQALARAGGQDSSGRLVVEFRIEGEPEVGGVVSDSAVNAEKSTATDPLMRECVQESMYALRLPPPKNGGVVKVSYPFVFSSGGRAHRAPLGQTR